MKKPKVYSPNHRRKAPPGRTFRGQKLWDNMYDKTWEAYRARYLAINTRCYRCGDRATVVDHLIPHQGDEKLFKKLDNHIPLCFTCHNKATQLFDRKHRVGTSAENKIKWMMLNRAMKDLTFRVKVLPTYGG